MPTIRADARERIDEYLARAAPFARAICTRLRKLIHQADKTIQEDWKWGPNFNKNGMVCGFGAFKQHVALAFFRGTLMKDPQGVFTQGAGNVTTRSIRFNSIEDVDGRTIIAYVKEAVKLNEHGLKPARKAIKVVVPAELQKALAKNKKARATFDGLAASYQREYAEHIAGAKQAETRARRLHKALALLEQGKSLNDQYKNC